MGITLGNPAGIVSEIIRTGSKRFRGLKLPNFDFSGMDLQRADFRNCSIPYCKFRGANLKFANFESANLYGSDFEGADCHRVNFKDAILSDVNLNAKDLYGATMTLECGSFQGMNPGKTWWYAWIFYSLLMKPPSQEDEDRLITFLGPERYVVLRDQYARRRM